MTKFRGLQESIKMSKVPKDMGKKVQEELQRALNEWTSYIPAEGIYKNPKYQKIERSEK